MNRRKLIVGALAGVVAKLLSANRVWATTRWCKSDPRIKVQRPNGNWEEGHCGVEVYVDDTYEWCTGDVYYTVKIPDTATDQKVYVGGSWVACTPGTFYSCGTGSGFWGHDAYVKFLLDSGLDFSSNGAKIEVSAGVIPSLGDDLPLRYYINSSLGGEKHTADIDLGTVPEPPAPLQDRIDS